MSKEPGKGHAAAKALLAEFNVSQMSQIPGPRLAEFVARLNAPVADAGSDLI
jgi:hypothetical protein